MTIKDIAKQCSVSVSTVSRVLNGKPDVSDDVRRKVQAVIDACNYIPNDSARVLVRTKSEAIGLVVRGVSNPFYTDIIHAIEKTVTDAGFSLVMQQIPSCGDEVQRAAVMEREKRLQGIIFLGGRFDYTPEDLTMLNVPFVCCSYSNQYGTLRVGEYSAVSIADEETARQAVDHLYDHGHRRIAALICREDDQSISQLRYQGYRKALESHGIPLDEDLVMCAGSFDIRDAYEAVREKLRQGAEFTALFAIADSMAIGAMRAFYKYDYRVPDDISIVGFDDISAAGFLNPPLTTIHAPAFQMGQYAAHYVTQMTDRFTQQEALPVRITLPCTLCIRESCGKPRE